MNVILLKDHNDNKSGDIIDVTPERANYLIRCQVAEYTDHKAIKLKERQEALTRTKKMIDGPHKVSKQTKQVKPKLEKK